MVLEMDGHTTIIRHDGHAAVDLARSCQPDIVMLDIGIPGMDGWDAARRIRQAPALKGVVLVAISGCGQDEDQRQSQGGRL